MTVSADNVAVSVESSVEVGEAVSASVAVTISVEVSVGRGVNVSSEVGVPVCSPPFSARTSSGELEWIRKGSVAALSFLSRAMACVGERG